MDALDAFRRFADLMPEPMMLVDGVGLVLGANHRLTALTGFTAAEITGRHLTSCTREDSRATVGWLRACARTPDPVPGTLTFLHGRTGDATACRAAGAVFRAAADGEPAAVLVRLVPKAEAVDPFLALNLRIEELTAQVARRYRAEQALHAERELLRVTLKSIGDAVITTDAAGCVTFLNPVAQQLTGWSPEAAAGRPLAEVFVIINEHTRAPVDSPVTRVLREGVVVGLANHTILIARYGDEYAIDDSAAPILDPEGAILGVVMVFHDVSERRRHERALERQTQELLTADRRKDEFLAMLAHELRNPMAPITTAVELLERTLTDQRSVQPLLDILRRQSKTLATLVDDLLDVSRITRGAIELDRQIVDLHGAVDDALESVEHLIEEKQHRLTLNLAPGPVAVMGDRVRLEQILVNLLSNAAKYTNDRGHIQVDLVRRSRDVELRVRDSGIGIAPDKLEEIFSLFGQVENGLDRSQGGLGVGLTISRRLVELHGGTIEARSEGAGKGAQFIVRLPGAFDDHQAKADDRMPSTEAPGAGRRILVVDDNADAADTLVLLLEALGHQVAVAYDGTQGLAKAREWAPEFVLLDIGLPGMDGYEVADRLRRIPATRNAVIMALTGYGQEQDRVRTREARFDAHFVKPVDVDALTAFIDKPRR